MTFQEYYDQNMIKILTRGKFKNNLHEMWNDAQLEIIKEISKPITNLQKQLKQEQLKSQELIEALQYIITTRFNNEFSPSDFDDAMTNASNVLTKYKDS